MQPLDIQQQALSNKETIEAMHAQSAGKKNKAGSKEPGNTFLNMLKIMIKDTDRYGDQDALPLAVSQEHTGADTRKSGVRGKKTANPKKKDSAVKIAGLEHGKTGQPHGAAFEAVATQHNLNSVRRIQSKNVHTETDSPVLLAASIRDDTVQQQGIPEEDAAELLSFAAAHIASDSFHPKDETAGSKPFPALHTDAHDDTPQEDESIDPPFGRHQYDKTAKPVFSVIDERTAVAGAVHADTSPREAGAGMPSDTVHTLDMLFDFKGSAGQYTVKQDGGGMQKETPSSFASVLARQVQGMSADFVQAGRIVLQDNNAGLIRLQMQPAHLGNVRISLELAGDKRVIGKIITASKETYEAFKESIAQLSEAFEQGGFASAQFDVAWSGESGGNNFAQQQEDAAFYDSIAKNERQDIMQGNRYADTQIVYDLGYNRLVNVFA